MAFGAADSRSASLALSPSLPLSLSPSLSSDAQMEDDDCMIDEPEGLNPGPEPLSPTHKRSAKSTQLPALVLVDFSTAGLLQQLQPGGHQARPLGLLGQQHQGHQAQAPRLSPQAQPPSL